MSKLTPEQVDKAIAEFKTHGYFYVRHLPDDSFAGLSKLIYTTAIHTGLNDTGYESRFCFNDPDKAREEIDKLVSADSVPSGNIAQRVFQKREREQEWKSSV